MILQEICRETLNQRPDEELLSYDSRWFTRQDIRRVADEVDALLDGAGVPSTATIALVPRNRPSAIAAEIGLLARGSTIRMIYAYQSSTGIAKDLRRSSIGAVILAEQDLSEDIIEAAHSTGFIVIAINELQARIVPGAERYIPKVDRELNHAPASIQILTSGTTGPPKHVDITYDQILDLVTERLNQPSRPAATEIPMLLYFPLANHSGVYSVLPQLLTGKRGVLLDRFNLEDWRRFVTEYRPETASTPPSAVQMILDADLPRQDLSSVKALHSGAAPLDPTVQRLFEDKYGIPILLSYGATEFNGPVTLMTLELYAEFGQAKLGSVGRPIEGAKVRAVNPETGIELSRGQDGLLEVVSPRIGPNWIRTTDLGRVDEEGFVFLSGRADGAIIRGGFKILPEAIERALMHHPSIAAASVVGISDPRLGQAPAAALELRPGFSAPSIPELERHVRDHVYATHVPTSWRFVKELPRTPSYKVDIRAVRGLFE